MEHEEVVKIVKFAINKHLDRLDIYGSYEDMLQEMLLEVYKKLPLYSPEISKLSTFIVMVVNMKFLHDIRVSKSDKTRINYECRSLEDEIIDSENQPMRLIDIIEDKHNYSEELENKLLMEFIEPLLIDETKMRYLEGMTQVEIAEIMNMSQANVSRKIRRNINTIRAILGGKPQKRKRCQYKALQYAKEHHCSIRTAYRHLQRENKDE